MVFGTYLNDHLAGATAGCDLVAQLDDRFRGTAHGPAFSALRTAIDADRASLVALMGELGVAEQKLKQALGWVAEKISRVKLSDPVAGGHGLGSLLAMEALGAGIQAKAALWENLRALAGADPRLPAGELDRLASRAAEQLATLRHERTAYAAEVLLADAPA